MNKQYIGDSVYVERDDDWPAMLILTTNNGYGASNRICLEPEVYRALVGYVHLRTLNKPE